MATIIKEFEIARTVKLTYDPDSPQFKEALESYIEVIDSDATADSMVKAVAYNLADWPDHADMIEGVGYVCLVGDTPPAENWSGIYVENTYEEQYDV